MIDRPGLADFLRRKREALRPSDVGLPAGARRRTPGLRREEVAQLAGVSTDLYSRLEQARGSAPSAAVVASLARALRLEPDERDHLCHLAGQPAPPRLAGDRVRPGLIGLASRLTDIPVCIYTEGGEVVWENALHRALLGGHEPGGGQQGNFFRRWFTEPAYRRRAPEEDRPRLAAALVADLRATRSRRPGDRRIAELVDELLDRSEEFRALWDRHEVGVRRSDRKDVLHPELGLIRLRCELLLTPDEDVRMLAAFPVEGTDAAEQLARLRALADSEADGVEVG
ncbi:helix-turn-helix transcriptional regulator [Phaeacidiphilus oryzae]|jgi:transcriptional regulator with XRE-family HTH domain|uniref:helix-turn-helix transcriptional regulator n=1 Tax=Phaeacidiphilus oryzae TaxID=348818 RepID=UPI000AC2B7AD|nr:helix-turn-helix transcriptional regulator [Phaeacidiphilus oryzae]